MVFLIIKNILGELRMSNAFQDLVGKEINVSEEPVEYKFGDETYKDVNYSYDKNDPVIKDIFNKNASARIILPNTMVTMDYIPTRPNVYIDKDTKGTWRITEVKFG